MRICLINPFSKFAAVRQYSFAKELSKEHKVWLMLPRFDQYSGFKKSKVEETNNLKAIHPFQLPFKNIELNMLLYAPSAILKTLFKNFDVVHGFRPTPFSGFLAYVIARIKRIPFVLELGDIEWETMENLKTHPGYRVKIVKWMESFLIRNASAITVMNENVHKYVKEHYNASYNATIISNGVDCTKFKPEKGSKEFGKNKKILMFVGKLDNVEHSMDLIKVLPKLSEKYLLVIVGTGKEQHVLEELAEKLKVKERVIFAGRIQHNEVPDYLNSADILLAPFARTKGVDHASNLKVFEYMAVGKPIIASKVGLLDKVLKGCGYTYEPSNLDELKDSILKVNKNIGEKAREKVLREFDWKVLTKKLSSVYDGVLK